MYWPSPTPSLPPKLKSLKTSGYGGRGWVSMQLQKPGEGITSPELTRVTGSCKPPNMDTGNQTEGLWRNPLNLCTISPAPDVFLFLRQSWYVAQAMPSTGITGVPPHSIWKSLISQYYIGHRLCYRLCKIGNLKPKRKVDCSTYKHHIPWAMIAEVCILVRPQRSSCTRAYLGQWMNKFLVKAERKRRDEQLSHSLGGSETEWVQPREKAGKG